MVNAHFQINNKASKPRYFLKLFLMANIKVKVILGMLLLKPRNVDILFGEKTLMWRFNTTNKAIPTIEQV